MSDDGQSGGGGGGGYKLEYCPNNRAACKGPAPCKGTKLNKGEIRFGTVVDFRGNKSMSYRHYGCITAKVWTNLKKAYGAPEEIEGFDELNDTDKEKFRKAWEEGKVDPADVPPSAIADADEDDAPKKKGRPKKQPKADAEDGAEPKPRRAPRVRRPAKKVTDDEISPTEDEDFEDGGSNYGSGRKRKRSGAKRAPAKKRAKKDDDDDE